MIPARLKKNVLISPISEELRWFSGWKSYKSTFCDIQTAGIYWPMAPRSRENGTQKKRHSGP